LALDGHSQPGPPDVLPSLLPVGAAVTRIPGQDVRVGMDIVFLGRAHRITSIEDRVHPECGPYRIASSDVGGEPWWFALWPDELVEVGAPAGART